jgi:hypothetical protein
MMHALPVFLLIPTSLTRGAAVFECVAHCAAAALLAEAGYQHAHRVA